MQRITITIDDGLAAELDAHMTATGVSGRSEAIRDLVRRGLATVRNAPSEAPCYGVVSCAIDQSVRQLATRIPQGRLDRHDQTVAALSVPLDHTTSIDVAVMRGRMADVTAYAEALFLERGVMHGSLGLIPVAEDKTVHTHEHGHSHEHTHFKVQSGL
ncbi:nickel-responsive transcriptional regulator NikR [Breoghania sp.]|uniref:nickel-responsive transcriptional regulator NikR n=1 Tax=Breoghania sp. TaxID=2065378 RepID=UPI00263385E4|nr:nickel-responsive transcriptional regulator NikR [Breoghania sp.]MDJ0933291.1 nickel-responsive transcriptional regulator NikR [Breoghania sp.]